MIQLKKCFQLLADFIHHCFILQDRILRYSFYSKINFELWLFLNIWPKILHKSPCVSLVICCVASGIPYPRPVVRKFPCASYVLANRLPRFDHCSLHCRSRSLNCSCRVSFLFVPTFLGHTFLVHCTVLTKMSRFVALVTDSGFFTLLAYASWLCPCLSDHRALAFCLLPYPLDQTVLHQHPWAHGARLPHEEDPTTSALTSAQVFSLAESFSTCFCTSGRGAKPFSNTPRFTVSAIRSPLCNAFALILRSNSLIAVTGSVGRIDHFMVDISRPK